MLRNLVVVVVAACASSPAPRVAKPAARWVYRVYTSGVESKQESVTTWVLDESAGVADETQQSRDGRDPVAWSPGPATHYRLAVTRAPSLQLTLTAPDGTATHYTCTPHDVEVAPATAMRVSAGGESGWKQGHWAVPTRREHVEMCADDAGSELVLAAEPIEHLRADDLCCGDAPSLRVVAENGAILPPRDAHFPAVK